MNNSKQKADHMHVFLLSRNAYLEYLSHAVERWKWRLAIENDVCGWENSQTYQNQNTLFIPEGEIV